MSRFSFLLRPLAFCAAFSLVAACGGGGGDSGQASTATAPITGAASSSSSTAPGSAPAGQSVAPPTADSDSGSQTVTTPVANAPADMDPLPPVDETPPEGPATGAARLAWLAPDANEDGSALSSLAGYRIRYGKTAATLDKSIDIENPSVLTYTVESLTPGTWYFEVVAVNDDDQEGPASNVGSKTIT